MPPKQSTASSVPVGQRQAPTPAAQDHGTDAAAFGAFLRSQREARQLTLQQVEAVTKIAAHQFIALERGDISRWPDGMYRRAMMRAYARAIGLDAEETVRTFVRVFSDEAADPPAEPQATAQPDPQGAAVIRRAGTSGYRWRSRRPLADGVVCRFLPPRREAVRRRSAAAISRGGCQGNSRDCVAGAAESDRQYECACREYRARQLPLAQPTNRSSTWRRRSWRDPPKANWAWGRIPRGRKSLSTVWAGAVRL